ncbi:hypothetical protein NPIL_91131 [Nephila pilipes]|uniref:EGF-like domain-containing protein n=1 Tax=Nephila pilipes TaxID=299642 RepID=A0A8X6USY4_NEPPI|nr:hypothetical protein NPIL_91131 [Nephila pilipes]
MFHTCFVYILLLVTACSCGDDGKCSFDEDGAQKCACNNGFSVKDVEGKKICEACSCGDNGKCSFDEDGAQKCACNDGFSVKDVEGKKICEGGKFIRIL